MNGASVGVDLYDEAFEQLFRESPVCKDLRVAEDLESTNTITHNGESSHAQHNAGGFKKPSAPSFLTPKAILFQQIKNNSFCRRDKCVVGEGSVDSSHYASSLDEHSENVVPSGNQHPSGASPRKRLSGCLYAEQTKPLLSPCKPKADQSYRHHSFVLNGTHRLTNAVWDKSGLYPDKPSDRPSSEASERGSSVYFSSETVLSPSLEQSEDGVLGQWIPHGGSTIHEDRCSLFSSTNCGRSGIVAEDTDPSILVAPSNSAAPRTRNNAIPAFNGIVTSAGRSDGYCSEGQVSPSTSEDEALLVEEEEQQHEEDGEVAEDREEAAGAGKEIVLADSYVQSDDHILGEEELTDDEEDFVVEARAKVRKAKEEAAGAGKEIVLAASYVQSDDHILGEEELTDDEEDFVVEARAKVRKASVGESIAALCVAKKSAIKHRSRTRCESDGSYYSDSTCDEDSDAKRGKPQNSREDYQQNAVTEAVGRADKRTVKQREASKARSIHVNGSKEMVMRRRKKKLPRGAEKGKEVVSYQAADTDGKASLFLDTKKEPIELSQWVIKPLPRGVYVEGHKKGDAKDEFWRSSLITKRATSRLVVTSSGTPYRLKGAIDPVTMAECGYSSEVISAFRNGFPVDWQRLIEKSSKQGSASRPVATPHNRVKQLPQPSRPAKQPQAAKHDRHHSLNSRRRTNNKGDKSPLDVAHLPTTRSGRRVIPQLAWWTGQRVIVHPGTSETEILPGTPNTLPMEVISFKMRERVTRHERRNVRTKLRTTKKLARSGSGQDRSITSRDSNNEGTGDGNATTASESKALSVDEEVESSGCEPTDSKDEGQSSAAEPEHGDDDEADNKDNHGDGKTDASVELVRNIRDGSNSGLACERQTSDRTGIDLDVAEEEQEECSLTDTEEQCSKNIAQILVRLEKSLEEDEDEDGCSSARNDGEPGRRKDRQAGTHVQCTQQGVSVTEEDDLHASKDSSCHENSPSKIRMRDNVERSRKGNHMVTSTRSANRETSLENSEADETQQKNHLRDATSSAPSNKQTPDQERTSKGSMAKDLNIVEDLTDMLNARRRARLSRRRTKTACYNIAQSPVKRTRCSSRIRQEGFRSRENEDPSEATIARERTHHGRSDATLPGQLDGRPTVLLERNTAVMVLPKHDLRNSRPEHIRLKRSSRLQPPDDVLLSVKRETRHIPRALVRITQLPPNCEVDVLSVSQAHGEESDSASRAARRSSRLCRKRKRLDSLPQDSDEEATHEDSDQRSHRGAAGRSKAGRGSRQNMVRFSKDDFKTLRSHRAPTAKTKAKRRHNDETSDENSTDSAPLLPSRMRHQSRHSTAADVPDPWAARAHRGSQLESRSTRAQQKSRPPPKPTQKQPVTEWLPERPLHSTTDNHSTRRPAYSKQNAMPEEIDKSWSQLAMKKLKRAMRCGAAACDWEAVADVVGRSVEDCQEQYFKDVPSLLQKKKPKKTKDSDAPKGKLQITGGVGTLKRKKQLRELVEDHDRDFEDDLFDATPMRNSKPLKIAGLGDVDQTLDNWGLQTPGSSLTPRASAHQTPYRSWTYVPLSDKKTPHLNLVSPGVLGYFDRDDADAYINRIKKGQKRRKLVHYNSTTPISSRNGARGTASPIMNSTVFKLRAAQEKEDSEDDDYYFSDQDES